ncbi:MAG: hypothetical protein J2P24_16095 [Streptosporangiales bacterium]|nr:hypothetical protein [Streptosporangiales bacterium]MBO0892047.1 hypothetical protein [Acidothermales bacterium]
MALPKFLDQPLRPLGTLTAAVAAFVGIFAYGQMRHQAGVVVVFMLPVLVLGLVARTRRGFGGWLFLAIAWVVFILGSGVLLHSR